MDMSLIIKIGILVTACVVGIGAKYMFKKDDSFVEQMAEKVVKQHTGEDIDFTPKD